MTTKTKTKPQPVTVAAAYTMPAREFMTAIKRAATFASNDPERNHLTCIHIRINPAGVRIIAANGFMLYSWIHGMNPTADSLQANAGTTEATEAQNKRARSALLKTIESACNGEKTANIEITHRPVMIAEEEATEAQIFINGHAIQTHPVTTYPNVDQVIPNTHTTTHNETTFSARALTETIQALKRSAIIAQSETVCAKISLHPASARAVIETDNESLGHTRTDIDAPIYPAANDPSFFNISLHFLSNALKNIDAPATIHSHAKRQDAPVLISNDSTKIVIMPLHKDTKESPAPAEYILYKSEYPTPAAAEARTARETKENIQFTREYCNRRPSPIDHTAADEESHMAGAKTPAEAAEKARAAFAPPTPDKDARTWTATGYSNEIVNLPPICKNIDTCESREHAKYSSFYHQPRREAQINMTTTATPAQVDSAPTPASAPAQIEIPAQAYTIQPTARPIDPEEAELRQQWTAQGIPQERQNDIIRQVTASAENAAHIFPARPQEAPEAARKDEPMTTPTPATQPAPGNAQTPPATTPAAAPRAFFVALTKGTKTSPAENVTMFIDANGQITAQRASEAAPHNFDPREATAWNIDLSTVLAAIKQAKRSAPATPSAPSEAQYTPTEPAVPATPAPVKVNPPPADPPSEPPTGGNDDGGPDDNDSEPIRKPQPKTPPSPQETPAPTIAYDGSYIDGTNQETFNTSFDAVLELLSSKNLGKSLYAECVACKHKQPDKNRFLCDKCGHNAAVVYYSGTHEPSQETAPEPEPTPETESAQETPPQETPPTEETPAPAEVIPAIIDPETEPEQETPAPEPPRRKSEPKKHTDLALTKTVYDICDQYNKAGEIIKKIYELEAEALALLKDAFGEQGYMQAIGTDRYGAGPGYQNVMKYNQKQAWKYIIEKTGIRRLMSIKQADEMHRKLEKGEDMPELTPDNVLSILASMTENAPKFLEEAIQEVYEYLRPSGGRSTYKTNQKSARAGLSEKVILPWAVEAKWSGGGYHVNYHRSVNLMAVDRVFHALDGQLFEGKGYAGPLVDAINSTEGTGSGETEYFRFTCYKNQNLHLEFKRPDLVARFNQIAAGKRFTD